MRHVYTLVIFGMAALTTPALGQGHHERCWRGVTTKQTELKRLQDFVKERQAGLAYVDPTVYNQIRQLQSEIDRWGEAPQIVQCEADETKTDEMLASTTREIIDLVGVVQEPLKSCYAAILEGSDVRYLKQVLADKRTERTGEQLSASLASLRKAKEQVKPGPISTVNSIC